MGGAARLGKHVIVLNEGGSWRGIGTAWKQAQEGHSITIVTPDVLVDKELQRSSTDVVARQALAQLGVSFITKSAVMQWSENGAQILSLLTTQTP